MVGSSQPDNHDRPGLFETYYRRFLQLQIDTPLLGAVRLKSRLFDGLQ